MASDMFVYDKHEHMINGDDKKTVESVSQTAFFRKVTS